jgi:hypothetical protein
MSDRLRASKIYVLNTLLRILRGENSPERNAVLDIFWPMNIDAVLSHFERYSNSIDNVCSCRSCMHCQITNQITLRLGKADRLTQYAIELKNQKWVDFHSITIYGNLDMQDEENFFTNYYDHDEANCRCGWDDCDAYENHAIVHPVGAIQMANPRKRLLNEFEFVF